MFAVCTVLLVLALGVSLVGRSNVTRTILLADRAEAIVARTSANQIQERREEAAEADIDASFDGEVEVERGSKQQQGRQQAVAEQEQPISPARETSTADGSVVDEASLKGTNPGQDLDDWLDEPPSSTAQLAHQKSLPAENPVEKLEENPEENPEKDPEEDRGQSSQPLGKFRSQLAQLAPQIIDERQVDVGIVHQGNLARLRSYLHKLRAGVPTSMAVVGGSITVGLGADGFGEVVFDRIKTAFSNNQLHFHNGAVGGVTSTYMASCMKWHVPTDVDLVIVEYNVNDGFEAFHCTELPCKVEYGYLNSPHRRAYERLLRKLLLLPHRPAVIMLQAFDYSKKMFMHSAEDQLGLFAQLYSLPWLSFRAVLWERQQRGAKGYSVEEVMIPGGGDMHPKPYGHMMLADLVTALMVRVGEGLLKRPFSTSDQAVVDADLLEPVLPGNIVWDAEYCIIDQKFKSTVTESPGFEWVDEAKPESVTRKWGFVATKPESLLVVTFSTASTTRGVKDPHTVLTINHLKSYEHMGQAEVTCISGCTCQPTILEGHWQQHNSQLSPHRFSVTQAPQCTLKIRVTNSTSSGEHKVKIQGIIIADEATSADQLPLLVPQIVPSDLMGASKVE